MKLDLSMISMLLLLCVMAAHRAIEGTIGVGMAMMMALVAGTLVSIMQGQTPTP